MTERKCALKKSSQLGLNIEKKKLRKEHTEYNFENVRKHCK